jgi:DNA-binding MarR family transcriptional regulator
MTPADEATFIQLWNAGTETAEIGRQLGLKATTAQSRARRLQERGLIQPRPPRHPPHPRHRWPPR